jgi:hypothetical protein
VLVALGQDIRLNDQVSKSSNMAIPRRKKAAEKADKDEGRSHHEGDSYNVEAVGNENLGAPSPRRSSRKRKIVSYNENKILKTSEIHEGSMAPTKKSKVSAGKQASARSINKKTPLAIVERNSKEEEEQDSEQDSDYTSQEEENEDEDDETMDDENASESGDEVCQKAKRGKKTASSLTKTLASRCSYCGKGFTSLGGLEYHVKRFVCRIGECKDPKIIPDQRKRKTRNAKRATTYKRFRGAQNKRTCKECGRVFTSVLGFKYHSRTLFC